MYSSRKIYVIWSWLEISIYNLLSKNSGALNAELQFTPNRLLFLLIRCRCNLKNKYMLSSWRHTLSLMNCASVCVAASQYSPQMLFRLKPPIVRSMGSRWTYDGLTELIFDIIEFERVIWPNQTLKHPISHQNLPLWNCIFVVFGRFPQIFRACVCLPSTFDASLVRNLEKHLRLNSIQMKSHYLRNFTMYKSSSNHYLHVFLVNGHCWFVVLDLDFIDNCNRGILDYSRDFLWIECNERLCT